MPHQDPDMAEELALHARGFRLVAGLDEVGRGALAGDVVAGAVILPADAGVLQRLRGVRDSKQLTPRQRSMLRETIQAEAIAIGLGRVSAQEIDRIGIAPATRQAMRSGGGRSRRCSRTSSSLTPSICPTLAIPQKSLIKGDVHCLCIAAASVMAKVFRDTLMTELDEVYPGYGFARHKGYGTAMHCQALRLLPSLSHPSPILCAGAPGHAVGGRMPMSDPRRGLGNLGENLAADYLVKHGYVIRERNYRVPHLGELDIVAEDGNCLVYVEVRTRRGQRLRHAGRLDQRRQEAAPGATGDELPPGSCRRRATGR